MYMLHYIVPPDIIIGQGQLYETSHISDIYYNGIGHPQRLNLLLSYCRIIYGEFDGSRRKFNNTFHYD